MTRCPRWEKRGWKQIMSSLFFERRSAAIFLLVVLVALLPLGDLYAQEPKMLVRISEIEIFNQHLEEYQRILNEEAEASMRLEPGVLCIFPTAQKDNPTLIRILEVYASHDAYDAHIKSPHFQKYKSSTLAMVKSLRLVDMEAMNAEAMPLIFKKMSERPSAPNTVQP
ncbi:putative quinol monooxygenase [Pseudomonas sp. GCEP-101]|uniref:putative quinol monooxygenase n=1 Tax=Pseudomonas sp. GCEP-101 TaxID=2974552 RepID=UPI00223C368C|nr:antibiotic biosynthesis monooxygenase [Pseudomonas sp. GCEP-101]